MTREVLIDALEWVAVVVIGGTVFILTLYYVPPAIVDLLRGAP